MSIEGFSTVKNREVSEGDLTKLTMKGPEEIEVKPSFRFDFRKAVIYSKILNQKYIR